MYLKLYLPSGLHSLYNGRIFIHRKGLAYYLKSQWRLLTSGRIHQLRWHLKLYPWLKIQARDHYCDFKHDDYVIVSEATTLRVVYQK